MLTAAWVLGLALETSAHGNSAENWHGRSMPYTSSQAETAGFAASELTAAGQLLTAQQQRLAFFLLPEHCK